MELGDRCHVCGHRGVNYIELDRRMKIAAIKLRLVGKKPTDPGFVELLNQEARNQGLPMLVAFEMVDGMSGLACGACLIKFNLPVQRMDIPEPTPEERDELFEIARHELGEEISDYLQKRLDF